MKNRFVVLLGLALLIACKRRGEQKFVISQKDSIHILNKAIIDSGFTTKVINKKQEEDVDKLDDKLKTISAAEYKNLDGLNKPRCDLDSSGFIKNLGVTLKSRCDEVCETDLFEIKSGKTMPLPTDFDAGLLGIQVSPQCDRFLTYSSYDMPDYDKYYAHQALIVLYDINKGVGLKAIKQKKTFGFNTWSIKEVKWLDERSIALKLYKEAYSDEVKFAYFKVKIE
ncbi:hypothetical protein PQ469_07270 [Mucilaginibacter sp. KACC 22773]|uniref:hypothetical protein n=1 Tax=Mucilaginibacter sp. KACC 22773 TaxID=3025671 RepID=UPI002365C469|nr:hypothetical protein [Mucilaginibacter sp. KACC 22773]WDF79805.1 hypothetical protein PQ469_07270 [Mucilaginibacter sp. KACC 22773]